MGLDGVDLIRNMHGYNEWATERILCCCDQLSPDEFCAEADVPWGSVRNQLVHMFIVHKRWLSWADGSLGGEEAYALQADPQDYPGTGSVRAMWSELNEQNQTFLRRLTPADLERVLQAGDEFAVRVDQLLVHIAYHSMQHRTEVAMALTAAGHSPGDVDYLFYAIQKD